MASLSAYYPQPVVAGTTAGTYAEGNDARLSDDRNPLSHAASHATGGSDAIAPNNISAAWAQIVSSQIITTDTTLSAGRNRRITLVGTGATANVDLPSSGNEAGDIVTLVSSFFVSSVFTIRKPAATPPFVNLATLSANGQSYTFVNATGLSTGWALVSVDTHTHAASAITSGTLTHERGGLEADVSAYDGLVKISGGSTSAVTVTTAGEALLDDADAAAQRSTLGLGTAAVEDTTAFAAPADIPDPSSATPQALGTAAAGTSADYSRADHVHPLAGFPVEYVIACSDETTALTDGIAKVTFRAPIAFQLTSVSASVTVAPTGSTLVVDINNGPNSVLSTELSIDSGEKTSATAATPAVINTSFRDFAADNEITIDLVQAGSLVAGAGLKVILRGTRL